MAALASLSAENAVFLIALGALHITAALWAAGNAITNTGVR